MEPLMTIELRSCTWLELAILFCTIEAELWVRAAKESQEPHSFVNREKVRRALSQRSFHAR
jgi:hypothetical protein